MRINRRVSAAALGLAVVGALSAVAPPAHADNNGATFTGEPDSLMRVQVFPRMAQVGEPITVLAAYRLAAQPGEDGPLPLPAPKPTTCSPAGSPTSTGSSSAPSTGTTSGPNTAPATNDLHEFDLGTTGGGTTTGTATGTTTGGTGGTATGTTPTSPTAPTVAFTVDYGDGTSDTPTPSSGLGAAYAVDSHPYATAGTYTLTVTATPSSSSGTSSTGTTPTNTGSTNTGSTGTSSTGGTATSASPADTTAAPTGSSGSGAGSSSVVYTTTVVVVGQHGTTASGNPGFDAVTTTREASRIDGTDRYETDTAISRQQFAPCSATAAVIATASSYKDALAAAPLAAALHAPVYLTDPSQLPQSVQTELTRVVKPASTVYILGGQAAVTSSIDSTLTSLGYTPQRIAGDSAPATSVAVAQAIQAAGVTINKVVVGSDADFPDMTAAAAVAAANQEPVLLTDPQTLSPEVASFLASLTPPPAATIIGGSAAVSDAVEAALKSLAQSVTRIGGADRYQTAVALAQAAFPNPRSVTIATGTNFPDALAGGPLAAEFGGPVLLVPTSSVPSSVLTYLAQHAGQMSTTFVLGGPGAVPTSVSSQVAGALGVPASSLD